MSKLLGCSKAEFKTHVERHWLPGMSWSNYGDEWELDHHVPLSCAPDVHWVEVLAHWTNVRPMWKGENADKKASTPGQVFDWRKNEDVH